MIEPLLLSQAGPPLIFTHANGYPPETYRSLLGHFLQDFRVEAIFLRPFWPGADPDQLRDWRDFRDDYLDFLQSRGDLCSGDAAAQPRRVIAIGHSVGAMTSLMAAIQRPECFRLLVLIEPVFFPRWRGAIMRLMEPLRIMRRVYPLIRGTLKRKTSFDDLESMYRNYRGKPIFQRVPNEVMADYVRAMAVVQDQGKVRLRYSPEWEARIYETSGVADRYVRRNLTRVSCPVLVLRGEDSETLMPSVLTELAARLPRSKCITLPGTGHLLPLEKPQRTAEIILDFIHDQSRD